MWFIYPKMLTIRMIENNMRITKFYISSSCLFCIPGHFSLLLSLFTLHNKFQCCSRWGLLVDANASRLCRSSLVSWGSLWQSRWFLLHSANLMVMSRYKQPQMCWWLIGLLDVLPTTDASHLVWRLLGWVPGLEEEPRCRLWLLQRCRRTKS